MIRVEKVVKSGTDLSGLAKDTVVLDWEQRRKSRHRVQTTGGKEVAISLPTGGILEQGDILYMDEKCYIAVESSSEDVLVVFPRGEVTSALIAYEIGNRHLPISIGEGVLITPYDRLFEHSLQKEGVAFLRKRESFEPIRKVHSHE